jgi:hypothetical protein
MERIEQINQRISQRNTTDTTPAFYFSPRPVPTKYTTLPILDQIQTSKTKTEYTKPYDVEKDYLPGNSAPWSGFVENIDIETRLRLEQGYIPSSKSSLYIKPNIPSVNTLQPYPGLFANAVSSSSTPTFKQNRIFYNSTSQKINY